MRIFPKITFKREEQDKVFSKIFGYIPEQNYKILLGSYSNDIIYLKKMDALTLFHELVHHIIRHNRCNYKLYNLRQLFHRTWDFVWTCFRHHSDKEWIANSLIRLKEECLIFQWDISYY